MELIPGMTVRIGRERRVGTRRVLVTADVRVACWDDRGFWIGTPLGPDGQPHQDRRRLFRAGDIVSLDGQPPLPGAFEDRRTA